MSVASTAFGDTPSTSGGTSAAGGTIVLPDTPQVTPPDAGAVWMNQAGNVAVAVAVTFPGQGLIITYTRPAVSNPSSYIQQAVSEEPGSQLISLNGVPAWGIPEPSNGSNWGLIQFIAGGAIIQIDGHTDLASLQTVAQSIVDRSTTSG